jgi:hypothetical protein
VWRNANHSSIIVKDGVEASHEDITQQPEVI